MEFCSIVLKQLDDEKAEIRTVVNTDVLLTLFRKKRAKEVETFYHNLETEIQTILETDELFGNGESGMLLESLGDQAHRTHRGLNNQGHNFISVLSVVTVLPTGGGLTNELACAIVQLIRGAMMEDAPFAIETATKVSENEAMLYLNFKQNLAEKVSLEELVKIAKDAVELEVRKENWKARV